MNDQTAETAFRVVMAVSPFVFVHLFPVFTYFLFCYAKEWEPSFIAKRPRAIYFLPVAFVGCVIANGILEETLNRPEFWRTANSYGYGASQGLAVLLGLMTYRLSLGWAHEFVLRKFMTNATSSHPATETAKATDSEGAVTFAIAQPIAYMIPKEVAVLKVAAALCLFFNLAGVLPIFLFRATAEGAAAAAQGLSLSQSLTAKIDATQFLLLTGLAQLVSVGVHGGVFGLLQRRDPRVKKLLVFWLISISATYLVRLFSGEVPFAARPFLRIYSLDVLMSPIIAWGIWQAFRSPECQSYFKAE